MKIDYLKFILENCVFCDNCGVLFHGPDINNEEHLCDRCSDLTANIEKVSEKVIRNHLEKYYSELEEKILIAVTKMLDKRFKNLIK